MQKTTMTRVEILYSPENLPFVELFDITELQVGTYDLHTETDFAIRFTGFFPKKIYKC